MFRKIFSVMVATTFWNRSAYQDKSRVAFGGLGVCSVGIWETHLIVSVLIELVAFGSPDGISQLASKIYKHLFLAFIFSDDWVTSAYVSNVAYFATAVASFISIGAVFSGVVGFIFTTASTWFVWLVFLSTDELF